MSKVFSVQGTLLTFNGNLQSVLLFWSEGAIKKNSIKLQTF